MYHIVTIRNEEAASGILNAISDAINNVFLATAKAATEGRTTGSKQLMEVLFEDSITHPDFSTKYGDDVDVVLYVNEVAMKVLQAANVNVTTVGTVPEAPQDCGIQIRSPRFI
jgi:hypothetical protein